MDLNKKILELIRKDLSEQEGRGPSLDMDNGEAKRKEEEKKNQFNSKYITVKIPKTTANKGSTIALPVGTKTLLWKYPVDTSKWPRFKEWNEAGYDFPLSEDLERIMPEGTLRSFTTPDGVFYNTSFGVKNYKVTDFKWYYDNEGNPYKQTFKPEELPNDYAFHEETWWEEWGQYVLMAGGFLASVLIPGAAGIYIVLMTDIALIFDEAVTHNNPLGAGLYTLFMFMPLIAKAIPTIGRITTGEAKLFANTFADVKNATEVANKFTTLPSSLKGKFLDIMKNSNPKILESKLQEIIQSRVVKGFAYKDPKEILNILNTAVKEIPRNRIKQWFTGFGFSKLGFELWFGAGSVVGVRYIGNTINKTYTPEDFINDYKNDKDFQQLLLQMQTDSKQYNKIK